MIQVINMMPYDMHVYETNSLSTGPKVSYPTSGKVTRIVTIELATVHGPELWYESVAYGQLEDFPDVQPDVYYIVPLTAALAARDRGDLLAPYKKIRNAEGRIVGCRHLQKVI